MAFSRDRPLWTQVLHLSVIVAALGYFVDIYDLVLFSIVRVPSLQALGFSGPQLVEKGVLLINLQMIGMLLGGMFWGVYGDKRGRKSVLFGSIILYSLANLANGMVHSVEAYAVWRFIAGLGLAGELGAGITLVSEVLPTELRGYGTAVVASFGTSGAILAGFIGQAFDWHTCYFVGGALGLSLLALRVGVAESGMFAQTVDRGTQRGDLRQLVRDWPTFWLYLRCILIGVPVWFAVGILVTFSPEFAAALGVTGGVTGSKAILFAYLGLTLGDFASGVLSQYLHSRVRVVRIFVLGALVSMGFCLTLHGESNTVFYMLIVAAGFFNGYWAVFVAIAAEQFGTNLRATVATTVPNFVRGSLVIMTTLFRLPGPQAIVGAGMGVGLLAIGVALFALRGLPETYGKNLDYIEADVA